LQDEVTQRVVTALVPTVEKAEIERAKRKTPANLGAYDYYLRGVAAQQVLSKESNEQSIQLLKQALALDPENVPAAGRLLASHASRRSFGTVVDADLGKEEVGRLVRLVVNSDDGVEIARAAWAIAYVLRDLSFAKAQVERAVALNPNASITWSYSGWISLWSGNAARGLEDLSRAMRLDPVGAVHSGRNGLAHAHFFLEQYNEALQWAEIQLRDNPQAHPGLRIGAASAAFAGKVELSHALAARLEQTDPGFRITRLQEYLGPYQTPELEKLKQGLRLAGLPE
jgi:tetratricopeptide (TPR) repeat protein